MGSAAEGEMLEVQVQRFCSPLEKKNPQEKMLPSCFLQTIIKKL